MVTCNPVAAPRPRQQIRWRRHAGPEFNLIKFNLTATIEENTKSTKSAATTSSILLVTPSFFYLMNTAPESFFRKSLTTPSPSKWRPLLAWWKNYIGLERHCYDFHNRQPKPPALAVRSSLMRYFTSRRARGLMLKAGRRRRQRRQMREQGVFLKSHTVPPGGTATIIVIPFYLLGGNNHKQLKQ